MSGHTPSPFSNAFFDPTLNSLRYNTSQYGSPVFIVYGTQRVSVNLLEYFNFVGSKGGSKGGKGLGGGGGKKQSNQTFTVDVAFAICQGPVQVTGSVHGTGGYNRVWSNGGIAFFNQIGMNFYEGDDGQAPDGTFVSTDPNTPVIGYSGLAYVTGTPLQLGQSPALPNIQFEIAGFLRGTTGTNLPDDARPDLIIIDMLCNSRYGAGFPLGNLDVSGTISDYGNYCQAATLGMSLLMDRQQPAARWLEEITTLTNAAVVWSGSTLKIIPYTIGSISNNGTSWVSNFTWQYSFTDSDYINFGPTSDPVIVTRLDPATMTNWLALEYYDSGNSFNTALVPTWDQSLIDQYGLRTEASVTGHEFTNPACANASVAYLLQRKAYVRTTVKFKVGWRFALLEPMDIILITDSYSGLSQSAFRITSIEEDDNWELTITAEEIPGITT